MMYFIAMYLLSGGVILDKKEVEKIELIVNLSIILVVFIVGLLIGSTFYFAFIESYKNGDLS